MPPKRKRVAQEVGATTDTNNDNGVKTPQELISKTRSRKSKKENSENHDSREETILKNKAKPQSKKLASKGTPKTNSNKKQSIDMEKVDIEEGSTLASGPIDIKISPSKDEHVKTSSEVHNTSSSESEWEDVDEADDKDLDNYKPEIPKDGIEITIDCPDIRTHKRKQKEFDVMDYIRLHVNRVRKDIQLSIHQVHLLCLLSQGVYINNLLNSSLVKGMALSLLPNELFIKKIDKISIDDISKITEWFRETFTYESERDLFINVSVNMIKSFSNKRASNISEYNVLFVVFARVLGLKARLCVSLYPITYKASNLIKKIGNSSNGNGENDTKDNGASESNVEEKKVSKMTGKAKTPNKLSKKKKSEEAVPSTSKRPKRSTKKSYKLSSDDDFDVSDEKNKKPKKSEMEEVPSTSKCPKRSTDKNYNISSDEDFDMSDEKCKKPKFSKKVTLISKTPKSKKNRKILSSDSEPSSPVKPKDKFTDKVVVWVEIFSKCNNEWIPVDCVYNIINKPYDIETNAVHPITYVLAYDNNSYIKDVTQRYCSDYMTSTRKLRIDPDWWEETLEPFLHPNTKLNKEEDKKIETMLMNRPMPSTIGEFKNHPLYALKRHLLKFEGIYPPDAPTVGFIRGEPVYARECVCTMHSRETWLKEARVVRVGEEPYKIVKARPKWDKLAGVMRTDLPLELFGEWQTEPYKPPVAKDGKVPRNEYGNVELFKPCMLPKGTVHLQIPGLFRVAKKLGIDCCPAVVGFDGHKGSVHPVFDGFIVCKEYKEVLLEAWEEDQVNAAKREEEKREKRIYGNWKKLIRGLLIREKLKLKYAT